MEEHFNTIIRFIAPQAAKYGFIDPLCANVYVSGNYFDKECNRDLESRLFNLAIICGSAFVQLPQILKILISKSSAGVSDIGCAINAFSCLCFCFYNIHEHISFGTWGETLLVAIQYLIILLSCWTYSPMRPRLFTMMSWIAIFGSLTLSVITDTLPSCYYPLLGFAPTPLMFLGKLPQIIQNYKQGHTGQLSIISGMLTFTGNLVRVMTTYVQVDDKIILMTHIIAGTLNLVPVLQILYYWNTTREVLKQKKNKKRD